MAAGRALRKRQTRLNFTPAASSSPHRPEAYVRIDDSHTPSKKRRTGDAEDNAKTPSIGRTQIQVVVPSPFRRKNQLPTPEPSSQVLANRDGSSSGESTDEETWKTNTQKARQFTILSADSDSDLSELLPRSKSRRHPSQVENGARKAPPKTPPSGIRNSRSFILGGTSGTAALPHGRLRRSSNSKKRSSEPVKSKKNRVPSIDSSESAPEDSDSNATPHTLGHSSPTRKSTPSTRRLRSSVRSNNRMPTPVNGASTSIQLRSASKANSPRTLQKKDELGWEFSGTESDEDETMRSSPNKASRSANQDAILVSSEAESSSGSDEPVTPVSRRSITAKRPLPPEKDVTVNSDLEGELAELQDSGTDQSEPPMNRTRGKPQDTKRSQYRNNLDKLKQMRRGADSRRYEDVDVSTGAHHEDINEDTSAQEADSDSEVEEAEDHFLGEENDEYETDFVVDDGSETVGVDLVRGGVPLALTSFANMKPYEYFKYEVEWIIHNKLDPAFRRYDEVYTMSHQKLDDEFKGRASSTFKSTAWTPDFVNALTSRPDFSSMPISMLFEDKCRACNRSKHPPKVKVFFSGRKYDENSLEPIDKDDSEEDTSHGSASSEGEEESFLVGRFCAGNAEIAHTLYHWRFHLNHAVLKWLSDEGHLAPEKIVQRESWNRKKRERLANNIVDDMDRSNEMKGLYELFKSSLDRARTAQVGKPLG